MFKLVVVLVYISCPTLASDLSGQYPPRPVDGLTGPTPQAQEEYSPSVMTQEERNSYVKRENTWERGQGPKRLIGEVPDGK